MRKPGLSACEQQRGRQACAYMYTQSDQHFCYSIHAKYEI